MHNYRRGSIQDSFFYAGDLPHPCSSVRFRQSATSLQWVESFSQVRLVPQVTSSAVQDPFGRGIASTNEPKRRETI